MTAILVWGSRGSKGWTTASHLVQLNGFRNFIPWIREQAHIPICRSLHLSVNSTGQKIVKMALKKEKTRAKSLQLLRSLRAKRLAGLAPRAAEDFDLERRIMRERSVRRLLALQESQKHSQELNQAAKVRILEKIAKASLKGELNRAKHAEAIDKLVQAVSDSVAECDDTNLCKLAVALVQLDYAKQGYMERLEKEVIKRGIGGFSHEEFSGMCWAFGTAGHKTRELVETVSKEVTSRSVTSFSSRSICQFLTFFRGMPSEREFFSAFSSELLTRNMSKFESWMLAAVVSAYSREETQNKQIFKAVEYELYSRDLKTLHAKDLVVLLTAFAKVQLLHRKLFLVLESVLILRRDIAETVSRECLMEFYELLKNTRYGRAEIVKIVEGILHPGTLNSIFDVMYREKVAWKEKVLKQSLFQPY